VLPPTLVEELGAGVGCRRGSALFHDEHVGAHATTSPKALARTDQALLGVPHGVVGVQTVDDGHQGFGGKDVHALGLGAVPVRFGDHAVVRGGHGHTVMPA
jgi:hypothetical protein